jgi:hypothetical protein
MMLGSKAWVYGGSFEDWNVLDDSFPVARDVRSDVKGSR